MAFKLRCPVCRKTFPYDPATERMPDKCRLKACGASIGQSRNDDDVVMPFVRSAGMKTVDNVYRDIERSSEVRAERAAEEAGVPVSEMAGLKVTNLITNLREGEIAAVPVKNEVTKFMEQSKVGGFQGVDASTFASGVRTGPHPNAGARMMAKTQRIFGGG